MSVPLAHQRTSLSFSKLNQLGHIPTREIARSIAANQSLNNVTVDEELNIPNKRLVLDAIHRSTTIESLTISVNPMDVGLGVNLMRKLKRLCFIGIESARASDTLTSLPMSQFNRNLQKLYIVAGNIGDSAAHALARSTRLRGCLLRLIRFSVCGLTSNGIAAIGLALQSHSLLKQVEICEPRLVVEEEAAAVFARGIEMNTSVKDLELSVKEVPILESKRILRAVTISTMLKDVEFSVDEYGREVSVAVARLLGANKVLETLCLSGRNLYVPPDALAENQSLRTFVVGKGIDAASFDRICDALVRNDTVKNLVLRCNQVTAEMILSVGRMLSNNSTLKSLKAHDCGINDDMVIALFESLTANQSLGSLKLSRNIIGNRGAAAIAAYVSTNQTCKKLELGGNKIGDEGFVALGNALKHNASLEKLDLRSRRDNVTERRVRAVLDGVKCHHVMKDVNFGSLSNMSHQDELDFYLERNKVAKPILDANLPLSIWPRVLTRAHDCRHVENRLRAPDMLFYFVKEKCDLFRRHPSNRKRKRGTNA